MTRIGDFGQANLLQSQMLRIQDRGAEAQRQVASGYKSADYAGLGAEAPALIGAQGLLGHTQQLKTLGEDLKVRLGYNDTALNAAHTSVIGLRDEVLKAIAVGDGSQLMSQANGAFIGFTSTVNTQLDGKYIFSGARTDTPPVSVDSVADLLALPAASDAFANDSIVASAQIDDGVGLEFGALASVFGTGMMEVIRNIAEFNAGPDGPLGTSLTVVQRTFLDTQVALLNDAGVVVQNAISTNGIALKELEAVAARQDSQIGFLTDFISSIQDADAAEAITRLNQDQTALQASYKVLGDLGQVSLLNFL